jgi:hypothetical protein
MQYIYDRNCVCIIYIYEDLNEYMSTESEKMRNAPSQRCTHGKHKEEEKEEHTSIQSLYAPPTVSVVRAVCCAKSPCASLSICTYTYTYMI